MANLRWVAEAYSNELPVYVPESTRLLKGDRVRITSGYFTGMEAEVVIQPGGGHKEVMARILDCMWVPLFEVKAGEYELIELNARSKHVYTHLDNDRLSEGLHEALGRYHASGSVCEEDRRLAGEVLREEEMICPDRVFLPRWGEEPVPVRADQGLIKQVMRILMDNAIKYSSPGSRIYLRLSTQERYARLTVQDEGDGIPPESIPHIFERFYRTDQSRDRKTGGTGLGLSIARWIVERHEGWFEVVSRPGVGTRISFLLPLALPEQEAG